VKLFDVKMKSVVPDGKVAGFSNTVYSTVATKVPFSKAKELAKGKNSWVVEHRELIVDLREKREIKTKKYNSYKHH